jgi:hypothetical protein
MFFPNYFYADQLFVYLTVIVLSSKAIHAYANKQKVMEKKHQLSTLKKI